MTQAQYQKVMGENPSYFQGDKVGSRHPETGRVIKYVDSSNHPVDVVSWEEAIEFCKRLSALPSERKAGPVYRLPTEAEWEYACRAGSKTAYCFGNDSSKLNGYAWYSGNSHFNQPLTTSRQTHTVGQKKPNAWGLYDMHGNVREWCIDWYGDYPRGTVTDPVGAYSGSVTDWDNFLRGRVVRGGCWDSIESTCRSASRYEYQPSSRNWFNGFRVTCVPSGQ